MIPLAGSAYTYAYATLGELLAWIIGWDLTLEYAMGASTVSPGWANYFIELLKIFRIQMPLWLACDHWTALERPRRTLSRAKWPWPRSIVGSGHTIDSATRCRRSGCAVLRVVAACPRILMGAPHLFGMEIGFNLPAFIIAL